MATGKLAYLAEPDHVEIREYDVPDAEPGSIVTEIVRANVCGSELHIWRGEHPHLKNGVLGHEALCRVSELGEGVERDNSGTPVSEGDLVVPAYFIACHECEYCGVGEFQKCDNALRYWSKPPDEWPHFHGTFATHYYVHPEQFFYRVPEGLDEGVAAAANCATSQMLCGMDRVDVTWNDTVVVQGAGGLGLNAVAVAQERGADTIVIDGVEGRLDRAESFGADHLVDMREYETPEARADRVRELTDGLGADVAVEVTGVPAAVDEGMRLLKKGGRYLEIGNIIPGKTTEFDPGRMTRKTVRVESLMRYEPWYLQHALDFLDAHADDYPFDELLDAEYDLVDVTEALEHSDSRSVTRASLLPAHGD
ncbi:MAG: zinc-binding dehydrogenase [Halobacteriaceae archaeon]